MEQEILNTLVEIKIILYITMGATLCGVVVWILQVVCRYVTKSKGIMEDYFIETASEYLKEAQYDELITHCKNRLSKKPNDPYALWWLGRAYRMEGKNDQAQECFSKILELEPEWEKEYVAPYQKAIKS